MSVSVSKHKAGCLTEPLLCILYTYKINEITIHLIHVYQNFIKICLIQWTPLTWICDGDELFVSKVTQSEHSDQISRQVLSCQYTAQSSWQPLDALRGYVLDIDDFWLGLLWHGSGKLIRLTAHHAWSLCSGSWLSTTRVRGRIGLWTDVPIFSVILKYKYTQTSQITFILILFHI